MILATDPNDSGAVRLADEVLETAVLPTGEHTRTLTGYAHTPPPLHALRRALAQPTTEVPTLHSIGIIPDPLAVTERLMLPPSPAVPTVYGPAPERGNFRPLFGRRGKHRMSWRMRLALALIGGAR